MKISKVAQLALISMAPAFAFAQSASTQNSQWDGYISGAVGVTSYGDDYTSTTNGLGIRSTGPSGEARASVAYTDKNGFGAQLDNVYSEDVTYGSGGVNGNSTRLSASALDVAAHFFYRTDKYLAGVYGQRTSFSTTYSGNGSTGGYTPARAYFLGGEGQYYFERATIYGQAGYQSYGYTQTNTSPNYSSSYSSPSGYTASLIGRYFISDNWKVDGGYTYGRTTNASNYGYSDGISYSYGRTTNIVQNSNLISIGTEYRLDNSPVSFFGKYSYQTNSSTYSSGYYNNPGSSGSGTQTSNLMSNTLLVGVKITFGTGSLIEQDRRGATLNPVNSKVNAVTNNYFLN